MKKPTPTDAATPWIAGDVAIWDSRGILVLEYPTFKSAERLKQTEANAALIVRAVNLLEAHEAVTKIALHFSKSGYKCEDGDELEVALARLVKLKEEME